LKSFDIPVPSGRIVKIPSDGTAGFNGVMGFMPIFYLYFRFDTLALNA